MVNQTVFNNGTYNATIYYEENQTIYYEENQNDSSDNTVDDCDNTGGDSDNINTSNPQKDMLDQIFD